MSGKEYSMRIIKDGKMIYREYSTKTRACNAFKKAEKEGLPVYLSRFDYTVGGMFNVYKFVAERNGFSKELVRLPKR